MTVGAMTFLPFVRSGLANQITGTVGVRAKVLVDLTLRGFDSAGAEITPSSDIQRDIELIGPGDIVGLDSRAIVRTEPRHGVTNFEPNYLAFVEFYPEDLPWRYTPAVVDTASPHRLRPWLVLIVLKEAEFADEPYQTARPLPAVKVSNASAFPAPADTAGWAHVHFNGALADPATVKSNDGTAMATALEAAITANPDSACSRVLCQRQLEDNTAYHAFLVPAFESGRLAGLGLDAAGAPSAMHGAWEAYGASAPSPRPDGDVYPFYHRYYFRTGGPGDFEYLVRLLTPKPVDARVGRRDIDTTSPGWGLRGVANLGGTLKLGGALRAPPASLPAAAKAQYDNEEAWDTPYAHDFQKDLANFVNLSDAYAETAAVDANAAIGFTDDDDADPMVTPPIYGCWHALAHRLLYTRTGAQAANNRNWLHGLNLDPRHRIAAGLGTAVIQKDQEELMRGAWAQAGAIIEANRIIRLSQLSAAASYAAFARHFTPLATASPERVMMMTAPVQARVMSAGVTVRHLVDKSATPAALLSAPMRRIARPGAPLARGLGFTPAQPVAAVITKANAGQVSAAPPRVTPAGLATVNQVADALAPPGVPPALVDLLARAPYLPALVLGVSLAVGAALATFGGLVGMAAGAAVVAGGVWASRQLGALAPLARLSRAMREEALTPAAIDRMPASANFQIIKPGDDVTLAPGGRDSPEAERFKYALREAYGASQALTATVEPIGPPLALTRVAGELMVKLDPNLTVQRYVDARVQIPQAMSAQAVGTGLVEAMCYPSFDRPMYKPLVERSTELFLPNIHLIPENSVTLLETNQAFIESYMVGLNHEFGGELAWRGYPTDRRGTPFRQFWDVAGFLDTSGGDAAAAREKLRDIPPIDRWALTSKLGDHDNRQTPGVARDEVVLAIRGDLLAKYPSAVIYAHKARWQLTNGKINNKLERVPMELTAAQEAAPPTTLLKTPLYQAKVEPDIYFLGFDLTVTEAKGDKGDKPNDEAGWFFVIKERPSEPRFGLDIGAAPTTPTTLTVWNDLNWGTALPGGGMLPFARTPELKVLVGSGPLPAADQEKTDQWKEDQYVVWGPDVSAADLAYILYQAPVRVALHAAEMLGAV